MFWLIEQAFIALLSFSGSLATKWMLINESFMIRPTLIALNPVQLNCYPFMNGIDKCSGSCNFVNDLSTKVSVPRQTKNVNLKVFNMIMWIIEKKHR